MKAQISGKAYVLGDNVDTDQIIPAQYLTFNPAIPEEYRMFGKYALSSVPPAQSGLPKGHIPFHDKNDEFISPYKIIVAGRNFGCGSSREHAPIALNAAGIVGRGRRVPRPHLLPQCRQWRLPHPVGMRRPPVRQGLHRRRGDHRRRRTASCATSRPARTGPSNRSAKWSPILKPAASSPMPGRPACSSRI